MKVWWGERKEEHSGDGGKEGETQRNHLQLARYDDNIEKWGTEKTSSHVALFVYACFSLSDINNY